jgi:hypothetical protein
MTSKKMLNVSLTIIHKLFNLEHNKINTFPMFYTYSKKVEVQRSGETETID